MHKFAEIDKTKSQNPCSQLLQGALFMFTPHFLEKKKKYCMTQNVKMILLFLDTYVSVGEARKRSLPEGKATEGKATGSSKFK